MNEIKSVINNNADELENVEAAPEIAIQTTQPTDDEKLWINPNETPGGTLNPITNEYSVAIDKGYSCNYVNNKTGVELYYNASGSTGNITLSDSVANYSEIEIEFSRSGYAKTTGRIKRFTELILDGYWYYYDSALGKVVFQNFCEIPSISGTTITRRDTYYTNVVGDGGGTYTGNFANGISIIRVIGYK